MLLWTCRRMWTRFSLSELVLVLLLCGSWRFPYGEEGVMLVGASACEECEHEQKQQAPVRKLADFTESLDGMKPVILATSFAPSPASNDTVSNPTLSSPPVAMQVPVTSPPPSSSPQTPIPSSSPLSAATVEVPVSSPAVAVGAPVASTLLPSPALPPSTSKMNAPPPSAVPAVLPPAVSLPPLSSAPPSVESPVLPSSPVPVPSPPVLNMSITPPPFALSPGGSTSPSPLVSPPESSIAPPPTQPSILTPAPLISLPPAPLLSPPVSTISSPPPPVPSSSPPSQAPAPAPLNLSPPTASSPPSQAPAPAPVNLSPPTASSPPSHAPAPAPVNLSPPTASSPPSQAPAPAPLVNLSPPTASSPPLPSPSTAVPPVDSRPVSAPLASTPAEAPAPVQRPTPAEAPSPVQKVPAPAVTSTPAEAPSFVQPVQTPTVTLTPASAPAPVSSPPVSLTPSKAPKSAQPAKAPAPARQPPENVVPSPPPNATLAPPPSTPPPSTPPPSTPTSAPVPSPPKATPPTSNTSVPQSPSPKRSPSPPVPSQPPAVSPSSVILPLPPTPAARPSKPKKSFAPASLPSLAFSPTSSKAPPPTSTHSITPPSRHGSSPSASPLPSATVPPPSSGGVVVAPQTASVPPAVSPSPIGVSLVEPPPPMVFPAPPNDGCDKLCNVPSVTTLPGTPCGCVIPMQVGLALPIPISTFLSLIPALSKDLAVGTRLQQNQVQVVGASVIGVDFSSTEVKANLVPLSSFFTNATAFRMAQKFWLHQVTINEKLFVNYTVLYVIYPGIPSFNTIGSTKLPPGYTSMPEQPLGVDIHKPSRKLQPRLIAMITLACVIAAIALVGTTWYVLCRRYRYGSHAQLTPGSSGTKRSVAATLFSSSSPGTLVSLPSSLVAFTSSVRTLSLSEMMKATDNFSPSRVIGQGGFGRVYSGVLDDDTKVAVKVLIREDRQGDKEFAAEVEMLSRLHHRNLVKLVGICTDDDMRCLVYELIPNGSVESHLHGEDRDVEPLSWESRLKIALGAARALAYLHEDSYPRVIHRDFKSSNILLEHDFTPKVSDFGLAKAASEELTGHISTRVMGTFGYVAPEYAMTGHLLVKSDVYSYGVVLLELLSGRKPVDMLRPQGQENLVTWARPLLTTSEGLDVLMEPRLGKEGLVVDNFAKVAAIASMCVQPEVSQRPFMGEVVQALKLVCEETDSDEASDAALRSGGERISGRAHAYPDWDEFSREEYILQDERALSASSVQEDASFGRHSAPASNRTIKTIRYQRSSGSLSDHERLSRTKYGSS